MINIKLRRNKNIRYLKISRLKRLRNVIHFTCNSQDNIAAYSDREKVYHRKTLKIDDIDVIIYNNAVFYTLDDIIKCGISETISNQIPALIKINKFEQIRHVKLSDMII